MTQTAISFPFTTHKKFLSDVCRTEGHISQEITQQKSIEIAYSLFEYLSRVINLSSMKDTLINIQGAHAKELFYFYGKIINSNEEAELQESLVEVSITTQFIGSKKRGEYQFLLLIKVNGQMLSVLDTQLVEKITAQVKQKNLTTLSMRFGVEWLTPHYFSWAGFAPSVDDYIHASIERVDDKKASLTMSYGGDSMPVGATSPIKSCKMPLLYF